MWDTFFYEKGCVYATPFIYLTCIWMWDPFFYEKGCVYATP
jgi:hypothetical protein